MKTGGKITKEIQTIGGIEVECNPKLIPEIKAQDSVESISPNHIKISIYTCMGLKLIQFL